MRPKLIIIAGPNGSGKTTFTPQMLQHDWADGCLFINPDEIAKNEFGDWNSPSAVLKAVVKAKEMREECLKTGQSVLIESVFSAPDKLDFIRRAKEADFFIRFFFIGTDSPEINAARVSAWVGQEEERRRLTLEALADVDAGNVVDHQDVRAWADSLGTETPLPVPHR